MNTVTTTAIIKRARRTLAHQDNHLWLPRDQMTRVCNGSFIVMDTRRNRIVRGHRTVDQLATDLGLLNEGETL